jgi:hypothetical protein
MAKPETHKAITNETFSEYKLLLLMRVRMLPKATTINGNKGIIYRGPQAIAPLQEVGSSYDKVPTNSQYTLTI